MAHTQGSHPAERMITVLDWWLTDHFDGGRNPRIEARINELKTEIRDQIGERSASSVPPLTRKPIV